MSDNTQIQFHVRNASNARYVCISGDHPQLGEWHPNGLPLENHSGIWQSTINLPQNTPIEFKVTAGTWRKEAICEPFSDPVNMQILANQSKRITLDIKHWRNNPITVKHEIQGKVKYLGKLSGEGIRGREVIVWLPTSYFANPQQRFPVLYMHDGQNLVDPDTAFMNSHWRMDETIESMSRDDLIQAPIVVGIYNTQDRLEEYNDTTLGKHYLNFIVNQVKPYIDKHFRTLPNKENTAVMGSSMGGLISFLATWYHPTVFGKAACLSPMFWGKNQVNVNIWKKVKNERRRKISSKLYIDNGTVGLERYLMPGCNHMIKALEARGLQHGTHLIWHVEQGAEHNEHAWANRVWRPLKFMFGKN